MVLCRKTLRVIILSYRAVETLIFLNCLQNVKLFLLMSYLKQGNLIQRFYRHLKIEKIGLRVGGWANFSGSLQEIFETNFPGEPLLYLCFLARKTSCSAASK